jgi:hypothetical protein
VSNSAVKTFSNCGQPQNGMEHAKPRTMARIESELIQWAVLKRSMTLLMIVVERTSATTVPVSMAACESTTAGRIEGPFSSAPRAGWGAPMIPIRRPAAVAAEVQHRLAQSSPCHCSWGSLHPRTKRVISPPEGLALGGKMGGQQELGGGVGALHCSLTLIGPEQPQPSHPSEDSAAART